MKWYSTNNIYQVKKLHLLDLSVDHPAGFDFQVVYSKDYILYSNCKQPTLFSYGKHEISRKNLKGSKKIFFRMFFHYFTRIPCLPWRMNCGRLQFEFFR